MKGQLRAWHTNLAPELDPRVHLRSESSKWGWETDFFLLGCIERVTVDSNDGISKAKWAPSLVDECVPQLSGWVASVAEVPCT